MSTRNIDFSIGEYYHVYSRGVDKRPIFIDEDDHKRFVKLLYVANSDKVVHLSDHKGKDLADIVRGECVCAIGAWCLMPNHFHLLIKELVDGGLIKFLSKLLTSYSMYFNKKYDRVGPLFQSRFKAEHVDWDVYLKYLYAYIHLNPIGIIDSGWKLKNITDRTRAKSFLDSYPYSSYQDYCGIIRPEGAILNKTEFPEYFNSGVDFEAMIQGWMFFDANSDVKELP